MGKKYKKYLDDISSECIGTLGEWMDLYGVHKASGDKVTLFNVVATFGGYFMPIHKNFYASEEIASIY